MRTFEILFHIKDRGSIPMQRMVIQAVDISATRAIYSTPRGIRRQ